MKKPPVNTPSRPVLRFYGGKYRLAPKIVPLLPPHRIYVEPFCGAASVLMAKPRAYSEVINDLDGEVCNLFHVLRDPALAPKLEVALRLTPFARAEQQAASQPAPRAGRVERARRLLIRSFMGFGSVACNPYERTGFRANSDRPGSTPAHEWARYPDVLAAFTARLQGIILENRDALTVIARHDDKDALIFADPPYVHSTRGAGKRTASYAHEMTDDDHVALSHALHGASGMVVLCGYECPLYDTLYKHWERVQFATFADGARPRVECVWFNPSAWAGRAQLTLLEGFVGEGEAA